MPNQPIPFLDVVTADPVFGTERVDPLRHPAGAQPAGASARRVWIDLDNTPHVPFFLPIIRELEREGHSVLVTARDAFQVRDLAELHGLRVTMVGRHYGKNKIKKVAGTLWRAAQLLRVVLGWKPDISMSHGSRPMVLVSALLRIPTLLLFDYEYAREIPFLKPAMGMGPEWIDRWEAPSQFRYGLRSYRGLKEDVYALSFRPDPRIYADLGVSPDDILVTIRPPATEAHYHNPEAETLYVDVVERLGRMPGVRMVILPRTAGAQREFVRRTWPRLCQERKIIMPDHPLDGLNLVWFSDLVVSGGGTMNREAAALGVPVYSIFRGEIGAVDRHLARDGRLVLIEKREEVRSKLRVERRPKDLLPSGADRPALRQILAAAHELMQISVGHRVPAESRPSTVTPIKARPIAVEPERRSAVRRAG